MSELSDFSVMREYRFAVVDSTAVEYLPEGILSKPLVPKGLAQSAHLMPGLIDLDGFCKVQWDFFYACLSEASERFQAPFPAILVATSYDARELARHWNAIQLPTLIGKHKFWLRIHDTRVLHQLLRILNPMQRLGLFGPAHAFHYWLGDRWTTALRDSIEGAGRRIASIGPLGWDWERIEQISIINRALHGAAIHDLSTLTIQSALAERLIKRAITHHRLSTKADLIEYTTRGIIFGPLFDEHPTIVTAIKELSVSECTSLSDRFALVEDAVWASFNKLPNSRPTDQI